MTAPLYVLSTDAVLSSAQRERLRREWAEVHRGAGKAHRVAVLEGGMRLSVVQAPVLPCGYCGRADLDGATCAGCGAPPTLPRTVVLDALDRQRGTSSTGPR